MTHEGFSPRSVTDAPVSSQSSSISIAVKGSGKAVDVSVTAGTTAWWSQKTMSST